MSEKIYVSPCEMEQYIEEQIEDLKDYQHLVAENKELGTSVWLGFSDDVGPVVNVEADGDLLYTAPVSSFYDTEMGFRRIYDKYLTNQVFQITCPSEEEAENEEDDEPEAAAESREQELLQLARDFVYGVYDGAREFTYSDSDVAQFLESALDYLARNVCPSIKRPLYLTNPDGGVSYEPYPYECMTFTA